MFFYGFNPFITIHSLLWLNIFSLTAFLAIFYLNKKNTLVNIYASGRQIAVGDLISDFLAQTDFWRLTFGKYLIWNSMKSIILSIILCENIKLEYKLIIIRILIQKEILRNLYFSEPDKPPIRSVSQNMIFYTILWILKWISKQF